MRERLGRLLLRWGAQLLMASTKANRVDGHWRVSWSSTGNQYSRTDTIMVEQALGERSLFQ